MRKTSKILITMLSLVVLFAVFAFGASAADYSGTISENITLQDGDTIGANGELIITAPITITVDGTVTVKDRIRIGDGTATGVVVTIVGDNNETDILLVDSAFDTARYRVVQVRAATLNMENVTLNLNGVAAQAIMGYNSTATTNLNSGAVVTGSGSAVGALYGWGTFNLNAGASVVSDNTTVGIDENATLNVKGGTITSGIYPVVFRKSTAKVNYYSGTLTSTGGKNVIVNNSTDVDGTVNVYQTWDEASDVVYTINKTSFGLAQVDNIYVTVSGQLNLTGTISIGQGVTLYLDGTDSTAALIGTGSAGMFSLTNGSGYTGTTLDIENLIIDGNTTSSTEGRPVLLNGSTNLNLRSGAIIKNGRRASASGGGVYVENGSVFNMYDGAKIINNTTGGSGGGVFVNTTGTFNMYGGEISGNVAGANGGAARIEGTMYMYGGTISDNTAGTYAGGLWIKAGKVYILDDDNAETAVPTFRGNNADRATPSTTSTYGGGAILTEGANSVLDIDDAIFDSNTTTQNGGAIAHMGGTAVIYNATFINNIAANNNSGAGTGISGGAVWVHASTLSVYSDVTFSGNMKYQTANDTGKLSSGTVTLRHKIYDVDDIIPNLTTLKALPFYGQANTVVMEFYADITTTVRPYFGGDILVEVVGMNNGTAEEPVYPVITKDANTTMSTSFVNIGSGGIVTMSNITFDVGLYDPAGEAPATELRAVYMNANSSLTLNSGAVIKGGYRNTSSGGGIYVATGCTLTLNDGSLITECSGKSGAGIYAVGAVVMNGGTISNCYSNSGDGGGAVYVGTTGTFTMNGGTLSGNSASNHGGAIFNWKGTVAISGGTITGNSASMGSFIRNYGSLTVSGGTISNNVGNGVIASSTSGTDVAASVAISDTALITGNSAEGADEAGNVYIIGGSLSMTGGTISDNIGGAESEGGAIRVGTNEGSISVTGGTISGNTAAYGGAIFARKVVELSDVSITGNNATVKGGGVYIGSSVATVTISGNTIITGNTIGGTTTCNIQKNSGFKSYDDEVYAENNWPNGWLVVGGEFTGSVGVYFEALPLDMNFDEIKLGVIDDGATVTGTISNDNGKLTYAELTDANGAACIALTATKTTLTVKLADGSTQSFDVADFDFYALPDAEYLPTHAGTFLGYVKVNGYGTTDAAAEAILAAGTKITAAELENLYATWVKVNTETGASINLSLETGSAFEFTTTFDKDVLNAVGIKVKADAASAGYAAKLLVFAGVPETVTADQFVVSDSTNAAAIHSAYGFSDDNYIVRIRATNYEKTFSYRGYIEITVGDTTMPIYSDWTYADHTRSVKSVAEAYVEYICTAGGEEHAAIVNGNATSYAKLLEITGHTVDTLVYDESTGLYKDTTKAANLAYYL